MKHNSALSRIRRRKRKTYRPPPKWTEGVEYYEIGFFDPFELLQDVEIQTECYGISGKSECGLVELFEDGRLVVRKGFQWDASGPTIDTPRTRRGSCFHDAMYTLRHSGVLWSLKHKRIADELLRTCMIEDGECELRANIWHFGVDEFGNSYWNK
tara:strand:+ start:19683 stop:20147 length:465 start_codon:yes stop_codon:yes gene_type:complete